MEISSGSIFECYSLEEQVGDNCYRARWMQVGVPVYVVSLEKNSIDKQTVLHQLNVIKHFNRMDYPGSAHLSRLERVYQSASHLWLVYDYLPTDLITHLLSLPILTEDTVKHYIRQVLQGLERLLHLK